jgi:hypothetical protein
MDSKSKNFDCCLLQAGISVGLLLNTEDGGDISTETSVGFQQAKWRYIPEDRTFLLV